MTPSLQEGWLNYQQTTSQHHAHPTVTPPKTYDTPPLCVITNCTKQVRMHRTAKRPYSKYCVDHAQHKLRHGHPTLKIPKISSTADFEPRCAYLAGKAWIKNNKDSEVVKRLVKDLEWELKDLSNWTPPIKQRRAKDMKPEVRWKWYRHHLLITNEVTPFELLQHHMGLLVVLIMRPGLFANDRMKHQFLAHRFIRFRPLPKHGADAYTGKSKQHQALDIGTAEWMYGRLLKLWDKLPTSVDSELEQLIKLKADEKVKRKEAWTPERRATLAINAKSRQNNVVSQHHCMTTGAIIGKTNTGKLKVIHRGHATDDQLTNWGVRI